MTSISIENYLKAVYNSTGGKNNPVTTSELAAKLDVSNAATSDMAKKLAKAGYVTYVRYKGLSLTEEGEKHALRIIRRHRLWELFLIKVLDLSWGEVHDEAEKLEHCASEFLIDKIEEYLDFPEFDPHGSPIPGKNGELPVMPKIIPLFEAVTGKSYTIAKVTDRSSELIHYISGLGISLNSHIEVTDKLSFDDSMTIKIGGVKHSFSKKITEHIFVSEFVKKENI